jgi:hypothetical protein
MALFEELQQVDVLGALLPAIKSRQLRLVADENANPLVEMNLVLDPETPWLHHHWTWERQCDLWTVQFNVFRIIPRGCRHCWKVAMKIPTLRQLMRVYKRQASFGSNCKCGTEERGFTGGLGSYRAFFYGLLGDGLEGGRELYRKVRGVFPGFDIMLKRGCTEFENFFTPSDTWDELADRYHWDKKEALKGSNDSRNKS